TRAVEVPASMEFFGTVQADYIQDFNRMDPNWVSSFRPSKIAAPEGIYGSNGQAIVSAKQSGFGVKGTAPIEGGEELTYKFDIDLGQAREIDPGLASALQADNKLPDFTARYRAERDWGHVQLAGIVRYLGYDTAGTPGNNPSGRVTGWGLNLTSNIKSIGSDMVHLGYVYGRGIASYMNDGGVDVAPRCQVIGNSC